MLSATLRSTRAAIALTAVSLRRVTFRHGWSKGKLHQRALVVLGEEERGKSNPGKFELIASVQPAVAPINPQFQTASL